MSAFCYTFCYKVALKIILNLSIEVIMLIKCFRQTMYTFFVKIECVFFSVQSFVKIRLTHTNYRRFYMNCMIVFFFISIVVNQSECMMRVIKFFHTLQFIFWRSIISNTDDGMIPLHILSHLL